MPDDPRYDALALDYRIGSVHYITVPDETPFTVDEAEEHFAHRVMEWAPDGDYTKIWKRYWRFMGEMIVHGGFDIIGHFDLVKKNNAHSRWFSEDDPAYLDAAFQVIDLAAQKDFIIEINTGALARGMLKEPYPSLPLLQRMQQKGIRITIGDDAHTPAHIGTYQGIAVGTALAAGYRTLWYLNKPGEWKEIEVDKLKSNA